MKEAAGEANMTVITIVLIAVVLTIGGFIVNGMMTSSQRSSCCASVGGTVNGRNCIVDGEEMTSNDGSAYAACLEDSAEEE